MQPGLCDIEPKQISLLFGDDCQVTHQLPAVYWLAHRLPTDFEQAVLAASNSGGQNVVRAALVGALVGAMNGLAAIPQRFLDQLRNSEEMLPLARQAAELGGSGNGGGTL